MADRLYVSDWVLYQGDLQVRLPSGELRPIDLPAGVVGLLPVFRTPDEAKRLLVPEERIWSVDSDETGRVTVGAKVPRD